MAIYRGDGGAGDATGNVSITEIQNLRSQAQLAADAAQASELDAEAAQAAAEAAEASALSAQTGAETARTAAETARTAAELAETNAEAAEAGAVAAAATVPAYEALAGNALQYARLNATEDTMIYRTALETTQDLSVEVGVDVQPFDATILNDADISVNVQAYSALLADAVTENSIGRKNAIINGNFDIWQRGVTSASNGYLADRWQTVSVGSTSTKSQQAFTVGQNDVPNNPEYFFRAVVSSGAGSSSQVIVRQPIEGVRTYSGQVATLSFWAKADAPKSIAVELAQIFGTGGSPSADTISIGVTKFDLTTAWQKFKVTVSVPSILGKTIGTSGDDNLSLLVWLDAGSDFDARTDSLGPQSGTFDIAQIQLEKGSVATDFEQRSIGEELALCQRYYRVLPVLTVNGSDTSAKSLVMDMRTTSTLQATNISGDAAQTLVFYDVTPHGLRYANGNANNVADFSVTADAEL